MSKLKLVSLGNLPGDNNCHLEAFEVVTAEGSGILFKRGQKGEDSIPATFFEKHELLFVITMATKVRRGKS